MTSSGPSPSAASSSAPSVWSSWRESIARQRVADRESRRAPRSSPASATTGGYCSAATARSPPSSTKSAPPCPPPSGWWTTSTSSRTSLNEVRTDLPPGFYRQLPTLVEGPLRDAPRAVGLAWAYVEHTDSRFESASLQRFVGAFQRVEPLLICELWAVPIALRLTLLENLRRLAEEIVAGPRARASRRTGSPTASSGRAAGRRRSPRLRAPGRRGAGPRLRGAARPAPPRPGPRHHAGPRLARAAARRRGHVGRGARARGASAPGRRQRHRAERHHEPARDGDLRLARVLREREPGRPHPPRRERVRRDGLRHARPLPQGHRGSGARLRARARLEVARAALALVARPSARRRGPRLLPDLARAGPRLEAALGYRVRLRQHLVARLRGLGDLELSRVHRHRDGASSSACPSSTRRSRASPTGLLGAARPPRALPRLGRGHRAGEPRGDGACSRRAPCRASPCRGGVPPGPQDPGGGAHPPRQRGADRRAGAPARHPLSGQRRRGARLRDPLRLDRRRRADGARRRAAARRRARRHRRAESPARARRGRRAALLPAAPPARLERDRGPLDRLGAQARQAPRAEPAPARRHGHDVHRLRRGSRCARPRACGT